jgi:transposase
MAKNYVSTDRLTQFLMPPSIMDWLPEDHLALFLMNVVDKLKAKTKVLHQRHPNWGPGRAAYDPVMLLTLLLYAYCSGTFSSRRIEAACKVDVAYKVITANTVPDHTTISRFRADNAKDVAKLHTEILALCAAAGMDTVGQVALDGTKIRADASLKANRTKKQIQHELGELKAAAEKKAAELLRNADAADAEEDGRLGESQGDELPQHLVDPTSREAHLDQALQLLGQRHEEALDTEREERAEKTGRRVQTARRATRIEPRLTTHEQPSLPQAEADLEVAREQAEAVKAHRQAVEDDARAEGRKPGGQSPDLDRGVAGAEAQLGEAKEQDARRAEQEKVNTTDPDSAIMVDHSGRFVQAYNAQAVVTEDQLIVAGAVTNCAADVGQYQPMVRLALDNLEQAGIAGTLTLVAADAGYSSIANFTAPGPARLIATTKAYKLRLQLTEDGYRVGDPPEGASAIDAMTHRLLTEEGVAAYAKRQCTVEPVFGQIKENRGYRRFLRRGINGANDEWQLLAMTHNLLKLFGRQRGSSAPAVSRTLKAYRRMPGGIPTNSFCPAPAPTAA